MSFIFWKPAILTAFVQRSDTRLKNTIRRNRHMNAMSLQDIEPIEKTKHGAVTIDQDALEPIAVLGFSVNFPQDAISAASFWQMLGEGRSAMTEVPQNRFNVNAFYHPNPERLDTVGCMFLIPRDCPGLPILAEC